MPAKTQRDDSFYRQGEKNLHAGILYPRLAQYLFLRGQEGLYDEISGYIFRQRGKYSHPQEPISELSASDLRRHCLTLPFEVITHKEMDNAICVHCMTGTFLVRTEEAQLAAYFP
jgi:hypothetical protein